VGEDHRHRPRPRRISLSIKQAAEGGTVAAEYQALYGEPAVDEHGHYLGPEYTEEPAEDSAAAEGGDAEVPAEPPAEAPAEASAEARDEASAEAPDEASAEVVGEAAPGADGVATS